MPRKIRELKGMLLKAGCACEKSKGSHTKWMHPKCANKPILSGNDSADAKPYQENNVMRAAGHKGESGIMGEYKIRPYVRPRTFAHPCRFPRGNCIRSAINPESDKSHKLYDPGFAIWVNYFLWDALVATLRTIL